MIIGIDPSLTGTAIATNQGVTRFTSAPCRQHGDNHKEVTNRMTRIEALVAKIEAHLQPLVESAVAIYIEGYSFASVNGGEYLAEYGGILRWHLTSLRDGLPVYEVAPPTLKKFATGKGNSKKEVVCAWIAKRYHVDFHTNDEYDAFALLKLGQCCEGTVQPETNYQQEVVEKILADRFQ